MEKIIHLIFDNPEDAFKGQQELNRLDANGDLTLAETYLITKDLNGKSDLKSSQGNTLDYTLGGAVLGGLLGILGGPVGLLFGASAGALAGTTGDLIKDDQTSGYLDEVAKNLPAGKTVIVAHADEEWEVPLNTSLEPFHAQIYRLNVEEQIDLTIQQQADELDREIAEAEKAMDDAAHGMEANLSHNLESLKAKRLALQEKISQKTEQHKNSYQQFITRQKEKVQGWSTAIGEKADEARRERTEKKIARYEAKLAALKAER